MDNKKRLNTAPNNFRELKPLYKPYKSDDKIKKVNFGAKGMDDWRGTDGKKATKEQRASFRARIKGIKRKNGSFAYKDKTSPAYWSLNYLW